MYSIKGKFCTKCIIKPQLCSNCITYYSTQAYANHNKKQIDRYINNLKNEVEHLKISSIFGSYCKGDHNHSPLGFLSYDNEQYIKSAFIETTFFVNDGFSLN